MESGGLRHPSCPPMWGCCVIWVPVGFELCRFSPVVKLISFQERTQRGRDARTALALVAVMSLAGMRGKGPRLPVHRSRILPCRPSTARTVLLFAPWGSLDLSVPRPALQTSPLSLGLFSGSVRARFYSVSCHQQHLSYPRFVGHGETIRFPQG